MRYLAAFLLVALFAGPVAAEDVKPHWDEETVGLLSSLPVQDGGRVKPFYALAKYRLLATRGSSSLTLDEPEGLRISAVEWLADVLFRPRVANTYKSFLVTDSAALVELGLGPIARKKRDRYSYDELAGAREALYRKGGEFSRIDPRERSRIQAQVFELAVNFSHYENLPGSLAFFPPPGTRENDPEWFAAHELQQRVMGDPEKYSVQAGLLKSFGELRGLAADPRAFGAKLEEFHKGVVALATARGEYEKIPLEVTYYQSHLLMMAQWIFVLGFVLVAVSWLFGHRGWISWTISVPLIAAWAMLTAAIVMRCIIRGRPPVTTLYETILFITSTSVITALLVELITRRRIALATAAVLGSVGMFLANRYDVSQAVDTMPTLVAVLDTNFWLATHVTTITLGYAAGLLAGAIAHVYIFGKLLGLKRGDVAFYKTIARMVYGVTCFALLFSVVGTLLGGIWANESWGRFWGWDPKENGALMICLWMIVMIHLHIGGHIREMGFAIAAVFGNMVIVFSWWHVILLGVGLHSYGFTSGILIWLLVFYALQVALMICGGVASLIEKAGAMPPPGGGGVRGPSAGQPGAPGDGR